MESPMAYLERLADLYHENPVLYDKSHRSYYRKDVKDNAIVGIVNTLKAEGVNATDADVRTKLKYLRDAYVKAKKKLKQPPSGAGADPRPPSWQYLKCMDWLGDHLQPQPRGPGMTGSNLSLVLGQQSMPSGQLVLNSPKPSTQVPIPSAQGSLCSYGLSIGLSVTQGMRQLPEGKRFATQAKLQAAFFDILAKEHE